MLRVGATGLTELFAYGDKNFVVVNVSVEQCVDGVYTFLGDRTVLKQWNRDTVEIEIFVSQYRNA